VVRVSGTSASRARPEVSRLSACSSCERSTTSMGPSSAGEPADGAVLVRTTAGAGKSPGPSKVGSVRKRRPPYSKRAVGPPKTRTGKGAVVAGSADIKESSRIDVFEP
jgi:hypothetical protein